MRDQRELDGPVWLRQTAREVIEEYNALKRRAPYGQVVMKKTTRELDAIADVVLAYRPKPKTKAAKRRSRKRQRESKGEQ